MAYDEELAGRVRAALGKQAGVTERKMFGGIGFMIQGNMACGIVKDELMVRVAPEQYDKLINEPGARLMDFTGRPMTGFLFVAPEALQGRGLSTWVKRGATYAASLSAK